MGELFKMAVPVKAPFGGQTYVSPQNHVLNGGTYGRHLANTIKQSVHGSSAGCHYHYYYSWLLIAL